MSKQLTIDGLTFDELNFRKRQQFLQMLYDRRMKQKQDFEKIWSDLLCTN